METKPNRTFTIPFYLPPAEWAPMQSAMESAMGGGEPGEHQHDERSGGEEGDPAPGRRCGIEARLVGGQEMADKEGVDTNQDPVPAERQQYGQAVAQRQQSLG